MDSYAQILHMPRVAVLLGATILGRLPFSINALAVLLFVRELTGSFAAAGIVSGGLALGAAFGAPLQGRLVDRRGEHMLLALAGLHATSLVGIWVLGNAGASTPALASLALAAGVAFPPMGSVLRSRWPALLDERSELITGAYALDSVMIEATFVIGPLLTALGVAVFGPEPMLGVSAALSLVGASVFVAFLPSSAAARRGREHPAGLLGALSSPGVRTMALATFPVGFCLGTVEVGLPAFSDSHGVDALAGVLLAIWSVGSALGGVVYGARPRRLPLVDVHARLAFLLPLTCLPLLAAGPPLSMAILVVFAGIPVAPLIASRNELVSHVAPSGAVTEAFTWPLTALASGLSFGVAAGGALVDAGGWAAALSVGIAVAAGGALFVLRRRATLAPAPA